MKKSHDELLADYLAFLQSSGRTKRAIRKKSHQLKASIEQERGEIERGLKQLGQLDDEKTRARALEQVELKEDVFAEAITLLLTDESTKIHLNPADKLAYGVSKKFGVPVEAAKILKPTVFLRRILLILPHIFVIVLFGVLGYAANNATAKIIFFGITGIFIFRAIRVLIGKTEE